MIPASKNADDATDDAAQDEQSGALENARLMTEFAIVHDGRYYHYEGYRYDRMADAISYAQILRARNSEATDSSSLAHVETFAPPTASDRQLMSELSISFERGFFVFAGFRYDRLLDAANYARDHGQSTATTS